MRSFQLRQSSPSRNTSNNVDLTPGRIISYCCCRLKCRKLITTFVVAFGLVAVVTLAFRSNRDFADEDDWLKSYEISIKRPYHRFYDNNSNSIRNAFHNESYYLMETYANNNLISLPTCPEVPPNLEGPVSSEIELETSDLLKVDEKEILKSTLINSTVRLGGWCQPIGCLSRHHVIVIIPYRDRKIHLAILLNYLHPILQRQQLDYRIVVVEQYGNQTFNKGRLMNAGFKNVMKLFPNYNCVIFHDVDLVPEDDRNLYTCGPYPKHMSPGVSKFNYTLPYPELIGGVLAITFQHYIQVNGYSNVYWGWGGEDDDMFYRMKFEQLSIVRPPQNLGRYTMMYHIPRTWISHSKTYKLLARNRKRYKKDGLRDISYDQIWIQHLPLYTHMLVDIGLPPGEYRL